MRFLGIESPQGKPTAVFADCSNLGVYEAATMWLHRKEGFAGRKPEQCPEVLDCNALASAMGAQVRFLEPLVIRDIPRTVKRIVAFKWRYVGKDREARPQWERVEHLADCGTVSL